MNLTAHGRGSSGSPGSRVGAGAGLSAQFRGQTVPVSKLPLNPPGSNKVTCDPRSDCGGVTALELLIVVSSLVILLAFAQPYWTSWAARKEIRSAVESVESSILAARQAARIYQTDIVLHLPLGPESKQKIFYSVPSTARGDVIAASKSSTLLLPEGVRVEAESDYIRFNSKGEVEPPATLLLVSMNAPSEAERIVVR